jgi:pyrroloquinoline quinone biosynthesis protein A
MKPASQVCRRAVWTRLSIPNPSIKETRMTWTTPAYIELRLGMEITMYIANR